LSKKNRCKRQAHQPQRHSKILFSFPAIRLLKNSLCLFEDVLFCKPEKLPNIPFAKQVVSELKTKLNDMLQREEWEKETPLDYNEICILYAAVHMYLIDLQISHQEEFIGPCIALCKQFAGVVEQIGLKQIAQQNKKC
jgi:hypothetical protein